MGPSRNLALVLISQVSIARALRAGLSPFAIQLFRRPMARRRVTVVVATILFVIIAGTLGGQVDRALVSS